MDINIRIGVTSDLCYDTVRNAAYYSSAWDSSGNIKKSDLDFWVDLNGNFLDIATLSWCYLFGDGKAEFRWQNLIDDEAGFLSEMCQAIGTNEQEFQDYIDTMRTYRDKHVAHRDRYLSDAPKMHYPDLGLAIGSTCFLFGKLQSVYPEIQEMVAHSDLNDFYKERLEHGKHQYTA